MGPTKDELELSELWQRAHDAAERFGRKYRLLANGCVVNRDTWVERESIKPAPTSVRTPSIQPQSR